MLMLIQLRHARADFLSLPVLVFLTLQLLDFLTTMAGLRVGAQEANPVARVLLQSGAAPVLSVLAPKLIALTLAAFCLLTERRRVIVRINYWFAALVVWNLCVIARAAA